MKKRCTLKLLLVLVLAAAMLLPALTALGAQLPERAVASTARLFVNGTEMTMSHGGNDPFVLNGTTYLSAEALSNALGVGQIPQDIVTGSARSVVVGGVMYLPLRAVSYALGFEVSWDGARNTISVRGVAEDAAPDEIDEEITVAPIAVAGVDGVRRNIDAETIMGIETAEITAVVRGYERSFTGVPLIEVLRLSGVNYSGAYSANLRATDGFFAFLLIEEVLDETNSFIVWLEDGEPVTEYGQTPFMLVVAQDTVPRRFVRNISEIEIVAPLEVAQVPELSANEFALVAGDRAYVLSVEFLEEMGLVEFDSGGGRYFTGVALLDILDYFDIDYSDSTGVRFVTLDGLTHEWTAQEAFGQGSGFVAVQEGGEPLPERYYPTRGVLVGFAPNRWMGQLYTITIL
ncbi:MAG: copper amine oxidase N-terminal domain-containing protein [Oscillospiraceae bacterium]|nr:copper amine oxidase N-terminal domain-containing protein [Oscillospiraceae bacterium]